MSNDPHILQEFDKLVKTLNETKGTNDKIEILQAHPDLKPLIKRIWDPTTKTGLTKKGLADFQSKGKSNDAGDLAENLYQLMDNLTSRIWTGDKARASAWLYIEKYQKYEDILLQILEKKPRIRLGAQLIMNAFPGIFQIFKVALAEKYTDEVFAKEYAAAGEKGWLSIKFDGVRLITQIIDGHAKFYSRAGNEFTSMTLLRTDIEKNIVPRLTPEELKEGVVFDGEMEALNKDGTVNFKETVSQARKKDIQMDNPRYNIFDYMRLGVFEGRDKSDLLEARFEDLADLLEGKPSKYCVITKQTPYTKTAFDEMKKEAWEKGWEGLMIRMNARYEAKRTKKLLKFKFFMTDEYKVEDVTIEMMPFANARGGEDKLLALNNVIIHHKGCPVSVGSGFDKAERLDFAAHPEKIKGQYIVVEFQEEFYDHKTFKYSLRIPIFKALIGPKRDF